MNDIDYQRQLLATATIALREEWQRVSDLINVTSREVFGPKMADILPKRFGKDLSNINFRINSINEALSDDNPELARGWDEYVHVRRLMPGLASELLAVIGGIYLQKVGLDKIPSSVGPDGLSFAVLAEQLVEDLNQDSGMGWESVLIVGEERLRYNASQIIRLRFPSCDLWHLPLTAHEYGYLVANKSGDWYMLDKFIAARDAMQSDQEREHFCRLFADAFATYFAGPAYIHTLLALRFLPDDSLYDSATDLPPFAQRFVTAMETLRQMNGFLPDEALFASELDYFVRLWQGTIVSSGKDDGYDSTRDALAQHQLKPILTSLRQINPKATRAIATWRAARETERHIAEASAALSSPNRWAVLNAAWLARRKLAVGDSARLNIIERNAILLLSQEPSAPRVDGVKLAPAGRPIPGANIPAPSTTDAAAPPNTDSVGQLSRTNPGPVSRPARGW